MTMIATANPRASQSPAITGPSMMSIHCKCGHEADFLEFKSTPITGDLPAGTYQCPACRTAWTTRPGPPRIGWSGMVLPGKTETHELPSVL